MARSLLPFVTGLLLYGLTAFVASPLSSYTTTARGEWSVGRALTFISMTFNAGAVIGPLIGGSVAERYGFRTVYFIAAGLFVISTLAVLMVRAQPRDHHDPDHPPAALLRNRRYLTFLAVFFFVAFAAYIPQPLSSNYLSNQEELLLTAIGQLISIAYLGTTILALVLGQLQARTGFLLDQVGVAAFAMLLWRGLGFGWFAVGYFLLHISTAICSACSRGNPASNSNMARLSSIHSMRLSSAPVSPYNSPMAFLESVTIGQKQSVMRRLANNLPCYRHHRRKRYPDRPNILKLCRILRLLLHRLIQRLKRHQ